MRKPKAYSFEDILSDYRRLTLRLCATGICLLHVFSLGSATNSEPIPIYMDEMLNSGRRVYDKQSLPTQLEGKQFLALGSNSQHNRSKVGFMSQEIEHGFTSQEIDHGFMRILDFQNFDQIS